MTINVPGVTTAFEGDGTSEEIAVVGPATICIFGDLGTGDITVSRKYSDGTFRALSDATALAEADEIVVNFGPGAINVLKVELANATNPDCVVDIQGSDQPG